MVCAFAQAQQVQTGYFRGRPVAYTVVDGMAITEGDILLGTAEEMSRTNAGSAKIFGNEAIDRNDSSYAWPDAVLPYAIDSSFPNKQRVLDAIQYWNDNTPIRIVPRTTESNWVRFSRPSGGSGCSSYVGLYAIGSQQILLGDECDKGPIIHEIGHALGLFHEQARQDRDYYIQVLYGNLDKREASQYNQHISDGSDSGGYDFGSIMHYGVTGFSRNHLPTMQTVPAGIPIGQRDGLSAGDLDAIKRFYGFPITATTVATFPAGLNIIVDGETYTAPKTFDWPAGSTHTLDVPGPQTSDNLRFVFGRWSDDGAPSHTITAGSSTTVYTANFIEQIKLAAHVIPSVGGKLSFNPPSPDGYFTQGTQVEITAVPNPNYNFLQWTGFGFFSTHGQSPNPVQFTLDDGTTEYDANFVTSTPTLITSDPPGQTVTIDGKKVVVPAAYTWSAGSKHTVTASTAPQPNYIGTSRAVFDSWSDGGEASHSATAAPGGTITAKFKTQYLVTMGVTPSNGGFIAANPANTDNFYDAGSTIELTPNATGSYKFAGWSGDATGASFPASLIVDDQKLLTANFAVPGQFGSTSLVNAANYLVTPVAPGEIITIFGVDLGPGPLTTLQVDPATKKVSSLLSDTRVLFDNVPAPLVYVSANQISAVVPYEVAGKTSTVIYIEYKGQRNNGIKAPVADVNPALFTFNASGRGPGAILNQDSSVNTGANPAKRGSTVVLYATGEGQTTPAGVTGKPAAAPLPRPALPVKVSIAGRDSAVSYAGGAPGFVAGVMQVNVRIPDDCPSGGVPVVLMVGNVSTPATVSVFVE